MALHEGHGSADQLFIPTVWPTEVISEDHERSKQLLGKICQKMGELAIAPDHDSLFSTYLLGECRRVLAFGRDIVPREPEKPTIPGQRIIVNNAVSLDANGYDKEIETHDYILSPRTGEIIRRNSRVAVKMDTPTTRTWNIAKITGPLFLAKENGDVEVHFGSVYNEECINNQILQNNDVAAFQGLLHDLSHLSPGCQEDVRKLEFYPH